MSVQPRVDLLVNTGPTPIEKQWEVGGDVSDVGALTYKVETANGVVQVATTAALKTGTGASTIYSFDLPVQTALTRLKITWARVAPFTDQKMVDYIEVFGSQLFTERDARASTITGAQTPFSDTTKYPDEDLAAWRLKIQDQFESETRRSWVRRYARVVVSGPSCLLLPFEGRAVDWEGKPLAGPGRGTDVNRIISITDNGTTVPVTDVVIDGRRLHRTVGSWSEPSKAFPLNVVIEYEYGVDPPDSEAHINALAMLHAHAIPNNISQAVESWSDESGSFRVGPEGWAYPSKVWQWMNRETVRYRRLPGFA